MFDGNGNWTSDFSAQADRDNGIKILASRFDNIFIADIKESFENCLTKDGQIMPIGNFNMGGQRITNMADGVNSNDAVNKNQLDSLLPIGLILPYGGTTAPVGFLLCNGAAVSRTTYSALFSVIGTTYGSGDGSTTFNLPQIENLVYKVETNVPCKGNGTALGITNGTTNYGLSSGRDYQTQSLIGLTSVYNHTVTASAISGGDRTPNVHGAYGITTDETKSGIVGTVTRSVLTCKHIIKYYGGD